MSASFASPSAPGEGIQFGDHIGALLLVDVLGIEVGINTKFGTSDAVKANVHVIEGQGSPETYSETLVFPKVLQSQLKGQVGQRVLGRLTQGQAKSAQSPPWILAEATPADIALAEAWVTKNAPAVTSAAAPF